MRINWNAQTARWFEAASEYTGFHEKLAALLLKHIRARDALVDLGCGAGLIDFALSPHIGRISCVDKDQGAVDAVGRGAKARGIHNLELICADANALNGLWDTALAVFFGGAGTGALRYLPLCREYLIMVVHGDDADGDYHPPKCSSVSGMRRALGDAGVSFALSEHTLEYGQPFSNREEALRFVTAYQKNPPGESADQYIDRLLRPGRDGYPLYLPNAKRFGIFIVGRRENEHI